MTLTTIFMAVMALFGAGGIAWGAFKHNDANAKVASVTADATTKVAAAQADRDQAIVAVAQVRDVIAQGNTAAAQAGVDAAQERTNVEVKTAAASGADNAQWMRDNGFIKDDAPSGKPADPATGTAS